MQSPKKMKSLKDSLASKVLYENSSGKERELKILEGFLKRLQLRNPQINSSESPDFLLNFDLNEHHATIGCEITLYFAENRKHGSAQERFVQQWKKFAWALRKELDAQGTTYEFLYGSIHFINPNFELFDRFNQLDFISEIVRAVRERNDISILQDFNIEKFPLLATHVHHINMMYTGPEAGILWWPSHLQSGEIEDAKEHLVRIVEAKHLSAYEYDWKNASERWLLIYSGDVGLSDLVGVFDDPKIQDKLGKINFDRVYVWNKYLESIDEIYPGFVNIYSATSEVLYRRFYPPVVRPFIKSR